MKSPKTVIDGAEITKNVAAQIKDIQSGGHNDVLENIEEGINAILALYSQLEYIREFQNHPALAPQNPEIPISGEAVLRSVIGLRNVINTIMNLLPDGDE